MHAALQAFSRSNRFGNAGDDVGAKRCAYPKIEDCDIDPRGRVWVGRVAIATRRNYEYATRVGARLCGGGGRDEAGASIRELWTYVL